MGYIGILFVYIAYKIVANLDFLNLFAINLFNGTDKDFVNQSVQYNLVQFCDCGILSDFPDKLIQPCVNLGKRRICNWSKYDA